MKLCAHTVTGGDTSTHTGWDTCSTDEAFRAIEDADTVPANYVDVSSIDNFAKFGEYAVGKSTNFMDWKCLRDELKSRVEVIAGTDYATWNSLSATEKTAALSYMPTAIIDQQGPVFFFTEGGTKDHINNYLACSVKAREVRHIELVDYVYEKLGRDEALLAEKDALDDDLIRKYIYRGVMLDADEPFAGIEDWLRGNAVDSYDTIGLQPKIDAATYTIKDATTTQDFIDHCVDILNGLY
jgi:hypothetical protein